jgi:hypothetical protein
MELQVVTGVLVFLWSKEVQSKSNVICGYSCGYLAVEMRVYCCIGKRNASKAITEIRKSKAGPKAYKLRDGGGLYL